LVWRIDISATAEKQLGKLDRPVAQRILNFLRERVAVLDDPRAIGDCAR
jgi:mRNA interferase RelE/StbE